MSAEEDASCWNDIILLVCFVCTWTLLCFSPLLQFIWYFISFSSFFIHYIYHIHFYYDFYYACLLFNWLFLFIPLASTCSLILFLLFITIKVFSLSFIFYFSSSLTYFILFYKSYSFFHLSYYLFPCCFLFAFGHQCRALYSWSRGALYVLVSTEKHLVL